MNPLFWLTYVLRSVQRSGRRGLFAITCVAVGVAGVVAVQIATDTVQNALTSNVRAANGGDISISSESSPLSATDLAVFRHLKARGQISEWTAVATTRAVAAGTSHNLVPFDVESVQSPPYPLGGEPSFTAPGGGRVAALLQRPNDVIISTVLAQELGASVGSRLLVRTVGHRLVVTVRGIVSETSFAHAATMTMQRAGAARLSDHAPSYTDVYVNTSANAAQLADQLRADFPSATVQTVQQALQQDEVEVHDFRQFMLLVGLLALLIAGIGTLNAMQSMLLRRRLEVAMLKAMGFGQGTLYALFGGEAVVLGSVGGVAGTLLGVGASKIIVSVLASALALQVAFVLTPGTLVEGVILGVGAALVFAVLPIVRAAAFRPLELLREGATQIAGWPRTLILLVLLMVLFAALAAVTLNNLTLALQLVAGAFAAFAVLTGVFALLVFLLSRLGRPRSLPLGIAMLIVLVALTAYAALRAPEFSAFAALATILWALVVLLPPGRLLSLTIALRNMGRRRTRAAVTLVAFLAGVLAMSLTLTVAISLRGQINDALNSLGSGNLVAIAQPSQERQLVTDAHMPGVKRIDDLLIAQTAAVTINGQNAGNLLGPPNPNSDEDPSRFLDGLTGYNLRQGDVPDRLRIVVGRNLTPADAGTTNVLLRTPVLGHPFDLYPGAHLSLRDINGGPVRTVTVVGFYTRSRQQRGFGAFFTPPILSDRSLVRSVAGHDAQVVVSLSVDPNHLSADATTLQRAAPNALVVDIGDLAAIVDQILSELLDVLAVITALVLGAGIAVVANGVALAMMERRREIALFKAIGFGPASVMRFVLVENALIGTLAGAVSVLLVAIALAVLSHMALRQAIGFDPVVALLVLAISTVVAVVIAYLAARTPIQVRPIEALRNE